MSAIALLTHIGLDILFIFSAFVLKNFSFSLILIVLINLINIFLIVKYKTEKMSQIDEEENSYENLILKFKSEINPIMKQFADEYGIETIKKFEQYIEEINTSSQFISNVKEIVIEGIKQLSELYIGEKKEKLTIIKNHLCPKCFANEVIVEFENYSKDNIKKNMTDVISLLEHIKSEQNKSYHRILQIITDFTKGIESGKVVGLQNNENLSYVFSKTQQLQLDIAETINNYYDEFKKIDIACKEIEEISEKIRMITLNLSIEASKSQNKAFNVIAHELQKLSFKTQDFVKNIMSNIKKSIANIELQKENKLNEIKEVNEQIEKARLINEEFERTLKGIYETVDKLSDTVNLFIEDKKNIFSVFENMQNIQIGTEIIEHFFKLINETILHNTDQVHEILGGKKGACDDPDLKKYIVQNTLDKLKKIITTEEERELVKLLYKKYLDVDLSEDTNKPEEGIILF
ncbi:MAG: methyl-accepting chemotaxis protein [Brevinematales bacterium]